ncbi:hypothetical protein K7X08_015059 [Anisodus acutangulus]|uniref:C2H2-type domain-containing protein n=1 Tax=Anisodus acutangulus TaxID=402998 RepID=A0A9Q1QU68_9SOLA|nr:hypothetical protein K7X08_015059 [Anisodus acutangulus]
MVDDQEHRGTETLWINLKIPKEEQVKDDQHIFGLKDEDKGKALGGHTRIHVQPANKEEYISGEKHKRLNQEIDIPKKKKKGIHNDEPAIISCSVCGKNFPSMKSLFGHMRCHPDRDWRGIQPPSNNNMSDHQKVDDLCTVVDGSSVTAKRGRSRNKPIIQDCSSEEDQQVHDAVQYLMLLAYGDSLKSGGIVDEELEIKNSNSLSYKAGTKKRTIEGTNICQMKRIRRRGRKMMKLKDLGSIQDVHQNTVFSVPEKYNEFNMDVQNPVEECEEEGASCSKLFVESTNECKNI